MKELTQSEIEKTERLSKACSQLVANQTGIDRKLNFGVAADKRNLSIASTKPKASNESRSIDKARTRFEGQKLTTRFFIFSYQIRQKVLGLKSYK